jgi:hypothetical protein
MNEEKGWKGSSIHLEIEINEKDINYTNLKFNTIINLK